MHIYWKFLFIYGTFSNGFHYTPRERSSGGYIEITLSVRLSVHLSVCPSVCLSVCPSVCADLCPAHNFFMVWHWLTIFGTWVYHHETMCRVHSWSRYDLELWPQGQIYRVFDMFSCPAHNFFLIDIGLPYLAHGCITIRQCVAYIHHPDSMLTFDLKVKFKGFCHVFMYDL